MINVKNIDLKDRFEEQELVKNRAKTLNLGYWKDISARNITQIKGLRTYCLELPYSMKFDLSNLYGQRMVELRLKGTPFAKNDFIKSESLGYILKNIREIKVLELPCCSSDLFDYI